MKPSLVKSIQASTLKILGRVQPGWICRTGTRQLGQCRTFIATQYTEQRKTADSNRDKTSKTCITQTSQRIYMCIRHLRFVYLVSKIHYLFDYLLFTLLELHLVISKDLNHMALSCVYMLIRHQLVCLKFRHQHDQAAFSFNPERSELHLLEDITYSC